jgi:hypothetical protein
MDEQAKPRDKIGVPQGEPATVIAQPNQARAEQPATAQQLQYAETQIDVRMSAFERSMIRLTRAGVIIAAITLIIFFGQLYEMHEGGIDTSNLAGAAQTQATAATDFSGAADRIDTKIGQAETAVSQSAAPVEAAISNAEKDLHTMAASSQSSIQATQETMRQDNRAWVGVVDFTNIRLEVGTPATYTVIFTNSGKSPAIDVHGEATGQTVPKGQALKFVYFAPMGVPSDLTIQPDMRVGISPSTLTPLTDVMVNAVKSGDVTDYLYGRFTYKDVFSKIHHLTFCAYVKPDLTSYQWCSEYNTAD